MVYLVRNKFRDHHELSSNGRWRNLESKSNLDAAIGRVVATDYSAFIDECYWENKNEQQMAEIEDLRPDDVIVVPDLDKWDSPSDNKTVRDAALSALLSAHSKVDRGPSGCVRFVFTGNKVAILAAPYCSHGVEKAEIDSYITNNGPVTLSPEWIYASVRETSRQPGSGGDNQSFSAYSKRMMSKLDELAYSNIGVATVASSVADSWSCDAGDRAFTLSYNPIRNMELLKDHYAKTRNKSADRPQLATKRIVSDYLYEAASAALSARFGWPLPCISMFMTTLSRLDNRNVLVDVLASDSRISSHDSYRSQLTQTLSSSLMGVACSLTMRDINTIACNILERDPMVISSNGLRRKKDTWWSSPERQGYTKAGIIKLAGGIEELEKCKNLGNRYLYNHVKKVEQSDDGQRAMRQRYVTGVVGLDMDVHGFFTTRLEVSYTLSDLVKTSPSQLSRRTIKNVTNSSYANNVKKAINSILMPLLIDLPVNKSISLDELVDLVLHEKLLNWYTDSISALTSKKEKSL